MDYDASRPSLQSVPFATVQSPPPPPPPKTNAAPTASSSDYAQHARGPSYDRLAQSPPLPPPSPYRNVDNVQETGLHPRQTTRHHVHGADVRGQSSLPPPQATDESPQTGWLPESILSKSKANLGHLLKSPELLAALLNNTKTSHPSLPQSVTALQQHLDSNLALATHVSKLEEDLISTRRNTSAHMLTLRALEARWRKRQNDLESRIEPWAPRQLHQRLVASIADGEAMCVGIEESFIDDDSGGIKNDREVGEWLKRVREGRKQVHLRRERRARWDEGRVGGWR